MHRRSKCAIENSRALAQSLVVVLVLGVVLVLVTVLAAEEVVEYVTYIQCTMHINVLFVQCVFLPTGQAETYLKICVFLHHNIYLAQLVRLE